MVAMRLTLIVVAALALGACNRTTFEKIPQLQINQAQKQFAEDWATKTMTAWDKGEYPQVGQEATREFRAGHNDEKRQQAAHKFVKGKVGKFQSLSFHEALRSKPPQSIVYRFKGDFERGEAEIRIVFDLEGKLNGHWIKPWRDKMN
jgi:hypothetical protein